MSDKGQIKVVKIGADESNNNYEVKLTKYTGKRNDGGTMYYSQRIRIATSVPTSDYFIWVNQRNVQFLALPAPSRVNKEINAIAQACMETLKKEHHIPNIVLSGKDTISFIRITRNTVGPELQIPLHQNLLLCVDVYGVFISEANKVYLQMELSEWKTKSLLD